MFMSCWIVQLLLVATALLPLVVTALENANVQISHLRPSVMIARSVETITIEGTNFVNDDNITCFFDDEPKAGMWVSSTKISCPAPTSAVPRIYQVRASSVTFTLLEQQLEVISPPSVALIAPTVGIVGTNVTFRGASFHPLMKCKFGDEDAATQFINSTLIECTVPDNIRAGNISMSLMLGDMPISLGTPLSFTLVELSITSILPSFGDTNGGTPVTVRVSSSKETELVSHCIFGDVVVPASMVDSRTIQCMTPPMVDAGLKLVGLSVNGDDFSMSSQTFEFTHPASFSALTPANGPELGGTAVTISGSNFVNSSDLACYFGDVKTRGEWMNSEEVSCVTPALRPGSYDVGLSFNGIDILDTTLRYRAYLKMTALAAVPSFGVATGSSQINVYGTNFRWEDNLYCRFGDIMVNATVVGGSNIIECVTPKWDAAVSVELSVLSGNGDVAVLVDKFDFYAPFQVLSMHPNIGFMRGGTSVAIYGKHFSQSRGPIHCVFGETSVEGRVETDTKIGCLSPASNTGGDFHLAIRHGSDEFKLDSSLFSYDNEILIDKSPLVVALSTSDKILDLHGSFFRNTTDLACRMMPHSKQLDAVFISASLVECRLPQGVFPGEYEVIVSNNGQDFSAAFLPLLVIDPFRVHSVNPSIQFRELKSTVTIKGSNFLELEDLWCIIDEEQVTQSHFINSTIIECSIPEDLRTGNMSLSLMLGDMPISLGTPLSFTLVELSITSILPSFGDTNGGTLVTVSVTGKETELVSHCIFGDEVVPASMIDSRTIQCTTPPMVDAGLKLVGLSVNGDDFSMSSQTFEFTHLASFSALTPANGPELGGTAVTVSGSNFVNSSDLACYFGDVKTRGEWTNSEEVSCVTPALRPGSYDVRLSFNGIDTHRTSLKFLYNFAIDILSVTPSMGSVRGGTVVSIRGKSFTPTEFLSCRFGDIAEVTPAKFISSTEVSCVSPDAGLLGESNSTVDISVSLNGFDFSPVTAQFLYSLPSIVRSVHPIRGSVNGGTEVIIQGDNFTPSTLPSCIFGNDSVSATVHSDSQMSCISPMHMSNEAVRFSVTLNGFDEAQTQTESGSIEFTYLPAIRSLQFEPNSGPSGGGTIITVLGLDFDETFNIRCKFGSHVVNATVVSNETIQCKSPPQPFGIVQFTLISEETDVISNDGAIDLFEYYKAPRILSANPVSGPHHGNTPVKVYGDFFRSTTDYICHFGDIPVQGKFLTVDSILCLSPENGNIEYSHVDLTITDREANFTQSSLSFSYVQLPTLKSVSPVHVFFEGGDSLVITGQGFNSTEEVWCRFSPTMPSTNISTDIITVRGSSMFEEESVACTTPSYPPTKVQLEVLVELSTNGHDWSTNNLPIYYVPNLSIAGVFPSLGSVDGGTSVMVYGTGFFEGDDLWCDFGVAGSVAATLTSYNELSCVTPSTSVPRNVAVSLSFMGSGDYVSSNHIFTYHRQLSLVEARPLRGFFRGGTAVTITGTGFVDVPTLSCRFGSIVAEAKFISQNMIECLSPPVDEIDKANLSISLNGVDFVSDFMNSNITSFQYDSEAEIDGIVPKNVPMSASTRAVSTAAETRHITLFGKGFINTTSLYCSYAKCDQITSGAFITESEVSCSLPQSCKLGEVDVRISFNGIDFSEQASTILFVSPATIADTYPKRVQEGSEMEILVSGENFVQSSELQCYFGSEFFVSKPGRWISNSSMVCTSPPLNLTYNGFQSLYISNNGGHDLSNSFDLGVTARSRFLSIQPSVGYIDGGTKVNITLSNVQYVSNLSCQFGQQKSIPAELVSANVVSCVSPSQHIAGSVTVKVFSDDIHLLAAGSFQYLNPPFLSSLRPNMGLIEGGSIVFVSGNNFVGVTTCRFSLDDGTMKVTRVTVTNDTAIVCQVPSADRPADAMVQLSHNGQDYVGRELRFSYKERPRIHSIVPPYGSDTGGKMVHMLGENFIQDAMMVHFGDSIVRASVISPKLLSCVTPSLKLGQTSVSISAEGIDFVSDDALHYESIPLPQISDITPKVGIIGRQTRVIVNTTKLFRTERLSCHFGDMTGTAVSISPNAVSCNVPKVAHVDIVNVTLSVDGERHLGTVGNHDQFTFVVEPQVTSAAPSIGWTNGGDLITFEVVDMAPFYSSTISCLFGGSNDPVKAVIDIENSNISCIAPALKKDMEERALIELIIDDTINTIRVPTKEYTYIHPSIVTKIEPPLGSIRGGSLVKVTGVNFSSMTGLSLLCFFGNDVVGATLQGDDIICRSPEWMGGPKKIIVSVGIGNNTEMVLESHATFEYLNHPSISQIRPRFGTPSGGTAVTITGNALAWMDAHKYLSCRFGNSSFVPAKAVEDGLLCVSPPLVSDASMVDGSFASNLTLYANHGSVQLASSDELFIYTAGIKINSLSTNSGPSSGGTVITLSIDGFRGLPTDDITCKFDKFESVGTYSKIGSDEYVECVTPAVESSQLSQTVLLQLGIDGAIESFSNGELFMLYPRQILTSIHPSFGFFEGGEDVLVTGTNFRNTTTLSCFFGDVPSPQTVWISDTSLMCTSPFPQDKLAAAPRSVNVTVTNNGVDFTNGSRVTEYHYTHRPDAVAVEPFVMNENNRTSIVISGKNLEHVNACLYGLVKHKYQTYDVTDNSVSCDVPKVLFEDPFDSVPIFLSLENGIISTGLDIRYEAPPVVPETIEEPIVSALEPRSGASAGGGWIRVTGEGFLNRAEIACLFGTLVVTEVEYVSSSEIRCLTPKHLPGSVPFFVTNGGLKEERSKSFVFTFVSDVSISSIFPSNGSIEGGTITRIYGSFSPMISPRIEPTCKFGSVGVVEGVLVSQNEIHCVSPPAPMAETVELRLSIDGGFNYLLSSSWFSYVHASEIEVLIPRYGYRGGGTPILVVGKNFRNETGLTCNFGESSVSATFISFDKVTCIHPPHQNDTDDEVIFTLNSDSGSSTSWKHFEYIEDPVITSIHPLVGTSLEGADIVVRGSGFRAISLPLYCVFGDAKVKAVLVDSSTMMCAIPRHPQGTVNFRVVDQFDHSMKTSTLVPPQFEFIPEPSIETVNINPTGNASEARTMIFARGSNFRNASDMSCYFGGSGPTKARALTETIMVCETQQVEISKMVNMSISHSGYASQSLLPVELGELSTAPNGTTMQYNATSCEPGSFKPRSDHNTCLPCPVGYFCPLRGMSKPLLCREGYICSELGLVVPSSPCVAGHYCPEGTKSSYPPVVNVEAGAWLLDDKSGIPTAATDRSLGNPQTSHLVGWKQHITTSVFPPSSTLSLSGFFSVSFSPYGTFTSNSTDIAFDAIAEDFKVALESIDGIGTLEVSRQDCDNPSITCTWVVAFIDFIGEPNLLEPDYSRLMIN